MVSGRPVPPSTAPRFNWVVYDKVAVPFYDGAATMTCEFTSMQVGPDHDVRARCPSVPYSLAAAYYPYDCNATFDAVNKTFNHTWGRNTVRTTGRL